MKAYNFEFHCDFETGVLKYWKCEMEDCLYIDDNCYASIKPEFILESALIVNVHVKADGKKPDDFPMSKIRDIAWEKIHEYLKPIHDSYVEEVGLEF